MELPNLSSKSQIALSSVLPRASAENGGVLPPARPLHSTYRGHTASHEAFPPPFGVRKMLKSVVMVSDHVRRQQERVTHTPSDWAAVKFDTLVVWYGDTPRL